MNSFEYFPDWLLGKWQEIADVLAQSIGIPAALIMKTENEFMEVFISSHSENNPYHVGAKEKWHGLYCETVIKTQNKLLIPNALKDKKWDKNPDIKLGMIAYLGFPLNFPDHQPFGTLCVLDNKERPFTALDEKLIQQFRNVIELDLALIQSFELQTNQLAETIVQETAKRKRAENALQQVHDQLEQRVTEQTEELRQSNENLRGKITERKQAEESLRVSEEHYRLLANNIPDIIYSLDREGNIVTVNSSAFERYGYTEQGSKGKPFLSFIHPADREIVIGSFLKAIEEQRRFTQGLQFRIVAENQFSYWFELNSQAHFDSQGRYTGEEGVLRDITERKQAEELLRASEERLQMVSLATQDAIYDWDIGEAKVYRNERYQALFSPNEPVGIDPNGWENQVHPDDRARVLELFKKAFLEKQQYTSDEYRFRRHDGTYAFVQDRGYIIYDTEGTAVRMIGAITDFTERKQAENELFQQKNILDTILESTSAAIFVKDTHGKYIVMNEAGARILGCHVTDVIGRTDFELLSVETASEFRKMDEDTMTGGQTYEWEEIVEINGKRKVFLAHKTPWRNSSGKIIGIIGVSNDITERKQAEELLLYKGTHDALTGIYNRAFFEVELARFEHSREYPASMIIADLDYLKVANDTWGHAVGDELIRNAANVLRSVFRESDVLARIGGDEFAVLLPSTDSASAQQMLARVQERLAKHNAEHPDLPVQLSLGTATAKKNNLTEAFTLADRRMYADKAARKGNTNHNSES